MNQSRHPLRRFDMYPDDWIGGTMSLTLEQEGAYLRVCCLIYSRGAPIPDDDRWLAGMCRVSLRKWKSLKTSLIAAGKMFVDDGHIRVPRCEYEIEKASKTSRKSAESGSKGGRNTAKRYAHLHVINGLDQADASATLKPTLLPSTPSLLRKDGEPPENHAVEDLGKVIFGVCLDYLKQVIDERQARALLAKWRRDHGDDAVTNAVMQAQRQAVSDPVSYITKIIAGRKPPRGGSSTNRVAAI